LIYPKLRDFFTDKFSQLEQNQDQNQELIQQPQEEQPEYESDKSLIDDEPVEVDEPEQAEPAEQ
jgi:hypothetical protein